MIENSRNLNFNLIKNKANNIVSMIDELLIQKKWSDRSLNASIVDGSSSMNLYLSLAILAGDSHIPRTVLEERLEVSINETIDNISNVNGSPWLHFGVSGIGWTLDRIFESGVVSPQAEDLNEPIDAFLLSYLKTCIDSKAYVPHELMTGLAGLCVYALGRPSGTRGEEILNACVELLDATAVRDRDGISWFCPGHLVPEAASESYKRGDFILGVAHGIPATVSVLGSAAGRGHGRAQNLYEGSLAWLKSFASTYANGSTFGNSIQRGTPNIPDPHGSRVAWCYGDLGIAAALLKAAQATHDGELASFAEGLALGCCNRPEPNMFIQDASLCHGSTGNLNIYNRLFRATGISELALAAKGCFEDTIANHWSDDHFFRVHVTKEVGTEQSYSDYISKDFCILEGTMGAGMALRTYLSECSFPWDGFFLTDPAPRSLA